MILIILCFLIKACAVSSLDRSSDYYQPNNLPSQSLVNESVFGENDKRINQMLLYKIKLPKKSRIAILKLNRNNNQHYLSNNMVQLNEKLVTRLITQLRSSNRVYDASFLPAMLIPSQPTVPALREAAARFQADLLLTYQTSCNSYQKYNFMTADETRAYCSVESVLLDIRSGIISKSVVSTQDFNLANQKTDKNFTETIKKAELNATSTALGKVAIAITDYLNNLNE